MHILILSVRNVREGCLLLYLLCTPYTQNWIPQILKLWLEASIHPSSDTKLLQIAYFRSQFF